MFLSPEVMRKVVAILDHPNDDFLELVRVSGLNPATSFIGGDLHDAVVEGDVTGFNFSDADLRGADFSRARNKTKEMFAGAITDDKTRGVP